MGLRCGRLLASDRSGTATPCTDSGRKPGSLHDTITVLEEQFASRTLFRRFVSAHSARGSQAQGACMLPSFLNATAGHLKCVFAHCSIPLIAMHGRSPALEELFASHILFRCFVSTHSSRESWAREACMRSSFLNATSGQPK